jgi:hypothetical protein
MQPRPSPMNNAGPRNLFCPYYEDCLGHAAARRWRAWHCSKCAHRFRKEPLGEAPLVKDPNPQYELPSSIDRALRYRFD